MGEVWRARHRLLIRPAAIKLIRQRALGAMAGDPELLVHRFEREARMKLSTDDSWSGTPGYMASEVVLGAATDYRVDLYALGCVAYWLLTGRMVFEGENAMQVMMQHAQAEPKRPSQRVDVPIPAALEELVMQCLEKDPARRPVSAEVVGERLGTVAGGGCAPVARGA